MKLLFTLILTLLLFSQLHASEKQHNDDVDYIALATILLKDGYYARANDALSHVNLEEKNIDLSQYYTLKGLVSAKQGFYKQSNKSFHKAIENGQTQKSIYIYIAKNSYKLKNYKDVIQALNNAKDLVEKNPKLMALKAESYYRLKNYEKALSILTLINERFPTYYDAYRQRFAYFINLGLYQSALDDAKVYLKHTKKVDEKVIISFISALRKAKEATKAIKLAETAHLLYSNNATITVLLANLYIDKGMLQSAAELFNQASDIDPKYNKDASEMYRRAKDFVQALYKNSQILDTKEKYKQKVAIYLEFGQYEKIVAAESALQRNGLLKEQNMLYALAYAYYKIGAFNKSEHYLKQITDTRLYQKAIELRKNMNKCKNNIWECTL